MIATNTIYRIVYMTVTALVIAMAIYVYRMGRADPGAEVTGFLFLYYLSPYLCLSFLADFEVHRKRWIHVLILSLSLTVYCVLVPMLVHDALLMPGPVLHLWHIIAGLVNLLNYVLIAFAFIAYIAIPKS